jgi:hypothetical protein
MKSINKKKLKMDMKGKPLELYRFEVKSAITNGHFRKIKVPDIRYLYLPKSMTHFLDDIPVDSVKFIEDDNRGAISQSLSVDLGSTKFYLSVKGIGSTAHPFSRRLFDIGDIYTISGIRQVEGNRSFSPDISPRFITGELWLRGSPYGGQGLEHATISLNVSEMADITSINGFRIAPLVNIISIPDELESRIKKIFWYRRFSGKIVQEVRLVPSNVRIFFHSGSTLSGNVAAVFDMFNIDTEEKAYNFLGNFVRSGISFLTLFVRSLKSYDDGTLGGYDFYDVWLDKDAVLAPDGTIYFVDLEGLQWIRIREEDLAEKIDDQIYRSLYEFMYAYEQIEQERARRFGNRTDRKIQFEHLLREGLIDDGIVNLERDGETVNLVIGNILNEQRLIKKFPIIDR